MSSPGQNRETLGPWRALARGVFVAVAEPDAVNIGLVVGDGAAALIDTGSSPAQGAAIRAAAEEQAGCPVSDVIITHRHRDHWFGLAGVGAPAVGHESLAQRRPDDLAEAARLGVDADDLTTPVTAISTMAGLAVGGRWIEAVHLGVGHTDGDLIVVIPDARIVFAGDLVESAGPPQFGPDADPRAWASTVDHLVGLTRPTSSARAAAWRVVPGHGPEIDAQQVLEQRARIGGIEVECRRLIEAGVPRERALAEGQWPFPAEGLAHAVTAMYADLGRLGVTPARGLPLLP